MSGNKIRLSGIRTTCTCSTLPEISEMHIKILNIFQDENVGGHLYGIGELSSI
jgi:hypothetical protein